MISIIIIKLKKNNFRSSLIATAANISTELNRNAHRVVHVRDYISTWEGVWGMGWGGRRESL
jgi:hypothetical protein